VKWDDDGSQQIVSLTRLLDKDGFTTVPQTRQYESVTSNQPPATRTATSQAEINAQVRALVKDKGIDRSKYSAQDLALLKQYEGMGAEKKTSTDVRILDQFFTPMDIVAKMWGLAFKYGFTFKNTAALEPSMGSGRFLEFIPKPSPDVIMSVTAFDVDETCYKICKVLYPYFDIRHGSFESLFFRGRQHIGLIGVHEFYDLVIGNPPYREYVSEYAPLGEKDATGAFTFEQYFITRGVDVLKPGGLLIYIIPNTFLSNDGKYNEFKEKLAKKADLIDAYRLPNGVFGNTEVGTDIIVLRRKGE
jgi:adenine-specific DNA methylase